MRVSPTFSLCFFLSTGFFFSHPLVAQETEPSFSLDAGTLVQEAPTDLRLSLLALQWADALNQTLPPPEHVSTLPLPSGPSLSSSQALTWGQALHATGWLAEAPETFEEGLLEQVTDAVRMVQQGHGLIEDGIVGSQVRTVLSTTPSQWFEGLSAWSQQLDTFAQEARAEGFTRMIVVNIPSFTLHAIDLTTGQDVIESRVIVGARGKRTPRYRTHIVNLKLNPDWAPPSSMAGRRYTRPGPNNPLGRVRFSTDKGDLIFLHDTDNHAVFEQPMRALSSGCVRVQEWETLALWLADWTPEDLAPYFEDWKTQFVSVPQTPVFLSYSTYALVQGRPARFPDVYGLEGQR